MAVPSSAPTAASTSTSASVCRTTWARRAPSAVRTATSRVRSAARASTRLATLTQAMTSTSSTAASIMLSRPTVSLPMNSSTYGFTSTVMPSRRLGSSWATWAAIVASSAEASSRDAVVAQPADDLDRGALVLALQRGVDDQRHPEFLHDGVSELGRHHADHGHRRAVDPQRLAQHVGPALEAVAPDPVADDHHRLGAGLAVGVGEVAAQHRPGAQHPEGIGGDPGAAIALGRAVGADDIGVAQVERRQVLERGLPGPPLGELPLRGPEVVVLLDVERRGVEDALRALEGQPAQHRPVQDAEHQGAQADAERQRHHRQGRHHWLPKSQTEGETEVGHAQLYGRGPAAVPVVRRRPRPWWRCHR